MQFQLLLALSLLTSASALPGRIVTRATDLHDAYDYVIIGGGTSGLVVANRLSENRSVRVLVLEAGPLLDEEAEKEILVPGFVGSTGLRFDWNITSEPTPGLNNRTAGVMAGRIAGGGSAVNGMFLDRGSPADYDEWATLTGDKGWGWDQLLTYFKKAETFTPPNEDWVKTFDIGWDPEVHGDSGPLQIGFPPFLFPIMNLWHKGLQAFGVPAPNDGGNPAIGTLWIPNSLDPVTRQRSYAVNAHHDKAKTRKNYHFAPDQHVTKILFNKHGTRAIGVEFATSKTAERVTVKANAEVILAAGSIHTPKILQLSGIGDARLLKQFKIPVIVDLPGVGENFQDHGMVGAWYSHDQGLPDRAELGRNETYAAEQLALFWEKGEGAYTASQGTHASFLPLPLISRRAPKLIAAAGASDPAKYLRAGTHKDVVRGFAAQRKVLLANFATNNTAVDEQVFTLASVQKPLSRGWVELASTDPWQNPRVSYNTLSNPFDMKVLVEGVRFIRALMASPAMQALNPVEHAPGAAVADDEVALEKWIREGAGPSFAHASGATKMGKRNEGAVVDAKLRVYGVKGLRIVDAGVMPTIPATHLTHTVYAVAEKAADLIKKGGN